MPERLKRKKLKKACVIFLLQPSQNKDIYLRKTRERKGLDVVEVPKKILWIKETCLKIVCI